jgi:nicotinamide-nucleotide amidase
MPSDTLSRLATLVGTRLKAAGETLATAESCTGGWVAQSVTAIAGSSEWFERGFVTYTNTAKQEMLGVSPDTLARHGSVSEQTAGEMASGALEHSHAGFALSITGVAGPTGGSRAKPVGTVCFGWARRADGAVRVETRRFEGDRKAVRRQSVIHALQGVIEWLDAALTAGG